MSDASTLTIVFRGLLVMHRNEESNSMEVGMLREKEHHFPRILTYKNGVLDGIHLLGDSDLDKPLRLEIDNPLGSGPTIYTNGSLTFDRLKHKDERDFRWIMDLEARDFYNKDLTNDMLTGILKPILSVPQGQFYTRLLSRVMKRAPSGGTAQEFGRVAAATGCDILLSGAQARLMKGDDRVFTFKVQPNTTYEFSNTPPDFPVGHGQNPHAGDHHGDFGLEDHEGTGHPPIDHFQFYYKMFPDTFTPKFEFSPGPDPDPAPDPFLCGASATGRRPGPLN